MIIHFCDKLENVDVNARKICLSIDMIKNICNIILFSDSVLSAGMTVNNIIDICSEIVYIYGMGTYWFCSRDPWFEGYCSESTRNPEGSQPAGSFARGWLYQFREREQVLTCRRRIPGEPSASVLHHSSQVLEPLLGRNKLRIATTTAENMS